MVRECQPGSTLARSSAQNQPKHWTAQNATPKTCHHATKTHTQSQPSHLGRDPELMEHDTKHLVARKPQHQKQLPDSVANITPLPEAHITQKNKQRPTSGIIRQHTQRHHSNHQNKNKTRTRAVSPIMAPDPVKTKQQQRRRPRTSPLEPMDYDTNHHDMDTHTQSTPGHTLAQRELDTQTPRNTIGTSNPETKQNPHLTTTLQTRDADGPRVGAEHITRLGVRPSAETMSGAEPADVMGVRPPRGNSDRLRLLTKKKKAKTDHTNARHPTTTVQTQT